MERINLKKGLAGSIILHLLQQNHIKHNGLVAEVCLTVNGVETPFESMLTLADNVMLQLVREKAISMLNSDEGLSNLRKALAQAHLAVRAAVDALPMPPGGEDASS